MWVQCGETVQKYCVIPFLLGKVLFVQIDSKLSCLFCLHSNKETSATTVFCLFVCLFVCLFSLLDRRGIVVPEPQEPENYGSLSSTPQVRPDTRKEEGRGVTAMKTHIV